MSTNTNTNINNDFYNDLGDRWYEAFDDPVALLRAENRLKSKWVTQRIHDWHGTKNLSVLDVGCGAGFLSNALSMEGYQVIGIDLSESSLAVARRYDKSCKACYLNADAYDLPFSNEAFHVITCMDFLEHVNKPQKVIQEISRALKPGGLFLFHTFNRNILSYIVVIKGVEWFVKNTPADMHVYDLFIKPKTLENYCRKANLRLRQQQQGLRPKIFSRAFWKLIRTRTVPPDLEFELTSSLSLSYLGEAVKDRQGCIR